MSNTWFRLRRGFFLSFFPSDTPHYPYLLPNGWEWCNLEDIVCELKYGTSEKSLSVGKIAVLRMGNITNVGTIDYSNLVYSSNNEDIKLYSLEKDDLLFNRTNSSEWVGKTAIYKKEQPAIYAGYLIRIRPILIFSDYLNTVMNSSYYRNWCYNVKTDAVNQSNINAQKLSQLMIPIPPLKEQERIVVEVAKWISLIDTIKNSKEDLQTTIKQAKSKILNLAIHGKLVPQDPNDEPAIELLKRINPDFTPCDNGHYTNLPKGWAICKLSDLCRIENGFAFSSNDYKSQGIPLVRISNITHNTIDITDCVYVEGITDNKFKISKGDLLIAMSGATTGKMGVYLFDEIAYLNQRVGNIKILNKSSLFPDYRNIYMQSKVDEILKIAYGGAQPNISASVIGNFDFPLPPYKEQIRIVETVQRIFDQLDTITESL